MGSQTTQQVRRRTCKPASETAAVASVASRAHSARAVSCVCSAAVCRRVSARSFALRTACAATRRLTSASRACCSATAPATDASNAYVVLMHVGPQAQLLHSAVVAFLVGSRLIITASVVAPAARSTQADCSHDTLSQ